MGKMMVELETRKKAVTELSKLKADLARNGQVSASEASALRRALAQREEELLRLRHGMSSIRPSPHTNSRQHTGTASGGLGMHAQQWRELHTPT